MSSHSRLRPAGSDLATYERARAELATAAETIARQIDAVLEHDQGKLGDELRDLLSAAGFLCAGVREYVRTVRGETPQARLVERRLEDARIAMHDAVESLRRYHGKL